jgi:hypothetical protein
MVRGGVALRICLGFDDAAAQAPTGELADDDFADEEAGEGDGIGRELCAAQAADRNRGFAGRGDGLQGCRGCALRWQA